MGRLGVGFRVYSFDDIDSLPSGWKSSERGRRVVTSCH